jgi:cell division protein ZapA (FtsZ GTPase activity inhibitor)
MRKWYFSFGRIKPIDLFVFIGINVVCSLYIMQPYFRDLKEKKQIEENQEQNSNEMSNSVKNQNETSSK